MVASEEKFRQMVFNMRVGVLLQGPKAEILLSNPAALELLALTEDQLVGRTSFDPEWKFMKTAHHFPETHTCSYCTCYLQTYGVIMGFIALSKDNVWLLVDAPQKIVNNSVQQVSTFIDITSRKEAELALVEKGKKKEINLTKR
jgi:PAS domain S-box-containing protein